MALSPKQLNAWTHEDEIHVCTMEKYIDALLLKIEVSYNNGEYSIVLPWSVFGKFVGPNSNKRLSALIKRYKDAGWGEVDGGVMGDGSALLKLREHKRTYSNPF
jgi:hypothetical protein